MRSRAEGGGAATRRPHGRAVSRRGHGRAAGGRPRRAAGLALALTAAAALALRPGTAAAQEPPEEPPMAESPRQFHLAVTAGALTWSDGDGPAVDGGALLGLDVERLLTPYASVRLAGAHGSTTVTGPDGSADVNAAVFELTLAGRAALPALRRAGIVPFAGVGIGSVVFDPDVAGLPTRSQNALSYGLGLEARPLPRIGVRAEWKHYAVELENLFEPTDRTGSDRDADRFQASVFWTF